MDLPSPARPGALALSLASLTLVAPLAAQELPAGARSEVVTYRNPADGMPLAATVVLPAGEGPFPGVALLSIADARSLVSDLVGRGVAVIQPERRGMTATDRLLRATFQDLANDALAATAYLAALPEVEDAAVGLVGQGDDSPAALLAAGGSPAPAFVVLISTTGLPGAESFALEQRGLAIERRWEAAELDALDDFVGRLTEIVLDGSATPLKAARLAALLDGPGQGLPRSAAFPLTTEGQVEFFVSAIWQDRLAFAPGPALSRIAIPTLVVSGVEDPFTPPELHLPAIRTALAAAPSADVTVCMLAGRTRHTFTAEAVALIGGWMEARAPGPGREAPASPEPASVCLEEDFGRR